MESNFPTTDKLTCHVTICEPSGDYSYNETVGIATTINLTESGDADAHFAVSEGGTHDGLLQSVDHNSTYAEISLPDANGNYLLRTWCDNETVTGVCGPERGQPPLPHADPIVNLAYESLKAVTLDVKKKLYQTKHTIDGATVSVEYIDPES